MEYQKCQYLSATFFIFFNISKVFYFWDFSRCNALHTEYILETLQITLQKNTENIQAVHFTKNNKKIIYTMCTDLYTIYILNYIYHVYIKEI